MKFNSVLFAGLLLVPFGPLSDHLKNGEPWNGFDAKDPVLTVVHAQKFPVQSKADCEKWTKALSKLSFGLPMESPQPFAGWQPWQKKEEEWIIECDGYPCKTKLEPREGDLLISVPAPQRMEKFFQLMRNRVDLYQKTGERMVYEYTTPRVDPWGVLEKMGFKTKATRPAKPDFQLRQIDYAPDTMKPLRQILDRRYAATADATEAAIWLRDVYTTHYFDSWGEWYSVQCELPSKYVTVVAALCVEFDLLKPDDIITKLSKGNMRNAIREHGGIYLSGQVQKVRKTL